MVESINVNMRKSVYQNGFNLVNFRLPRGLYQSLITLPFTQSSDILLLQLEKLETVKDASRHGDKVSKLSVNVLKKMGTTDYREINNLRLAALLHDIGKLGVSANLINNPKKLSLPQQFEMQQHTKFGAIILSKIPAFEHLSRHVLQHHLYFDGTRFDWNKPKEEQKGSYPEEVAYLAGGNISLFARIITVCDAFDAMTNKRPYNLQPLSPVEAINELISCAGKQFDPKVVEAFIRTR